MGTEVALSFSTLRTQLENEKSSLYKIDENIKKIVQTTGRYSDRLVNDFPLVESFHIDLLIFLTHFLCGFRFNNQSGEYVRGGARPGRNSYPDSNNYNKNDELFGKRKHETKTVFSR